MASSSSTPALHPPPGQMTNFLASNTLWKWNVLCQTACLLIPGIMVILRVYIRIRIKRVWILEDYMCCLAFITLAIYSGLLTTIVSKRGGVHEWNLTKSEVVSILYFVNIIQICYGVAAACIKSAILLLYLRVFSPYRWSKFDVAVRAFLYIICAFYFAITIAKICQCLPRARIWDKTIPGHCVDLSILLGASGLFNVISDVCILLVPLKGVWNLKMHRKRKVGIYSIFTVGLIAPIFSIIGLVKRYQLTSNSDQSYNQPSLALWATAELATGVMIICLPTLPAILKPRLRRPSLSVVNSSIKYRGLNPHSPFGFIGTTKDRAITERDYFELRSSRRSVETGIRIPPNAFVNEIKGGEEDHHTGDPLKSGRDDAVPPGGILKMVKIEQSEV